MPSDISLNTTDFFVVESFDSERWSVTYVVRAKHMGLTELVYERPYF